MSEDIFTIIDELNKEVEKYDKLLTKMYNENRSVESIEDILDEIDDLRNEIRLLECITEFSVLYESSDMDTDRRKMYAKILLKLFNQITKKDESAKRSAHFHDAADAKLKKMSDKLSTRKAISDKFKYRKLEEGMLSLLCNVLNDVSLRNPVRKGIQSSNSLELLED